MEWGQASVKGLVRTENEDDLCVCPDIGLFAVADGMGGHRAGEVASSLALKTMRENLIHGTKAESRPEIILQDAVLRANSMVFQASRDNEEFHGMGTTVTACFVRGNSLTLAHVGDSRAYLIREGDIHQLTEDHSLVQGMVRRGELTAEQAKKHPQSNVLTRAVGTSSDVMVDTASYELQKNDRVLLCTDGLTRHVGDWELLNATVGQVDLQAATESLLEMALARGGTDNITVIIIEI